MYCSHVEVNTTYYTETPCLTEATVKIAYRVFDGSRIISVFMPRCEEHRDEDLVGFPMSLTKKDKEAHGAA